MREDVCEDVCEVGCEDLCDVGDGDVRVSSAWGGGGSVASSFSKSSKIFAIDLCRFFFCGDGAEVCAAVRLVDALALVFCEWV